MTTYPPAGYWRHNGRLLPDYLNCTCVWPGPGVGRWWKRRLSKARRRWQDSHRRGLASAEAECNYKTW
jgi:hypothetical protein